MFGKRTADEELISADLLATIPDVEAPAPEDPQTAAAEAPVAFEPIEDDAPAHVAHAPTPAAPPAPAPSNAATEDTLARVRAHMHDLVDKELAQVESALAARITEMEARLRETHEHLTSLEQENASLREQTETYGRKLAQVKRLADELS